MRFTLKVWRQENNKSEGKFKMYVVDGISENSSFLEMIDVLNEDIMKKGEDPIHFDHDCREGICGACSMYVNGRAHGPQKASTTCQLYMRNFNSNDIITVEPWRSNSFPVIKDLIVDRSAFDRIIQSGGYISVNTGGVPDANEIAVPKLDADEAFEAAACIGCGACVAACKNASAMLFVAAKVSQLSLLPQGKVERRSRVDKMVSQMDKEGFGACTNTGACSAECPKEISLSTIARLNREYFVSRLS